MTPNQCANIMRVARELRAARQITTEDFCVLDYLLWKARKHGMDRAQKSLTLICKDVGLARATVVQAIKRLAEHRLLSKVKDWIRVKWKGFWVNRQATNVYVFARVVPEFTRQPVLREDRYTKVRTAAPVQLDPDLEAALQSLSNTLHRSNLSLRKKVSDGEQSK